MPKGRSSRHRRRRKNTAPAQDDNLAETSCSAPTSSLVENTAENRDFATLPKEVLESVLLKLPVEDIKRFCCCCRAFYKAAAEQSFWQQYCHQHWGHKTSPSQWLVTESVSRIPNRPQPGNYMALGMLLSQLDSFMGFWRGHTNTDGHRHLFKFIWMPDCLACYNLTTPLDSDTLYIGPYHAVTGEIVDGCHCILRDYGQTEWSRGRSSTTAAAVASVTVGSLSDQTVPTGFETEMTMYIRSTVQSSRKNARRRHHRADMIPHVHHLTRLPVPPSKKTSLTGLWLRSLDDTGLSAQHYSEVILIQYHSIGARSQFNAFWIAGTQRPPHGETLWRVSAKPSARLCAEGIALDGCGFVWDEHERRYVESSGFLQICSDEQIAFQWQLNDAADTDGNVAYHRLREDNTVGIEYV